MRRVVVFLCLLAPAGCARAPHPTIAPFGVRLAPELNKPAKIAPQVAATEPFAIASGTPIAVHFFATYSLSALADADLLVALPPGNVIGVSLDLDGALAIDAWRDATHATYAVVTRTQWQEATTSTGEHLPIVPTTLVIDKRGAVVFEKAGMLTAGDMAKITRLLEAP